MNKFLTTIAIILALGGTSAAYAQPNQDHTCQGGHNCNEAGGNSANQWVETNNSSTNSSSSDSESNSAATSNASSDSNSGGNTFSDLGGAGGQSRSSSSSAGGISSATGGGVNFSNIETKSAASAATVYSQVCQLGGSAQGIEGGFSITNSDVLCDHLKVASAMQAAYEYELSQCTCVGVCTTKVATVELSCPQGSEMADVYLAAYHDNMQDAVSIMNGTSTVGLMDKIAGAMVRPLAVIGLLIWLI